MLTPLIPLIQVQRHDEGLHGVHLARVALAALHGAFVLAPVNLQHTVAEAPRPQWTGAERDERHGGEHRTVEVVGGGVELTIELAHYLHVWFRVRHIHHALKVGFQRVDGVFALVLVISPCGKLYALFK